MKYKILMCLALLAGANFLYLIVVNFFQELSYANLVLGLNGLFIIILVTFQYRKQQEEEKPKNEESPVQQSSLVVSLAGSDQILIEHFPDFLCLKDEEGRWLQASRSYLEAFNLQDVDYKGKTDMELTQYPPSNVHALKLSAIQDKSAWHLRQQVKETRQINLGSRKDEVLEILRTPVFDSKKNKLKLILTGHFVSGQEKEKAGLDLVSYAFQAGHLSFVFLDENFRINGINTAFSLLTGYVIEEVENRYLSFMTANENDPERDPVYVDFFKSRNEQLWSGELSCRHKNGHIFPIKLDITEINKENQSVIYFASLIDITRQKQSEKRIMQIAHYDELTGLVNRVMFFDRLSQILSTSALLHAVILFIDLDRFKAVNDSLGHDAGDELLKETATRLLSIVGNEDVVARLSGDEFALLLLNDVSHEQAMYSASMIAEKILQKLSEVFYIHHSEIFIGASIGISIYPEDGTSVEILLKHADISMYEAKKQGRNNYQFYKKDYTAASQDRLSLERNLRKALEKNELQLYYQPQYHAVSQELCGAEVLVRWLHGPPGQAKMIPPDYFIPIAEETGLIIEIGKWILRTACLQLKKWLDEGHPLRQISVNVSARQFTDNNFLSSVDEALQQAGLPPEHLEMEITESMLIGDTKQIELQLNRLKKMGVTIVLDDFGTGYSSLSYLKNFPIDVLKIDQSFVKGTALYSKNARIACAIINMGHSLGQKIVAEGVETEQQLAFLSHRGCDIIQGYYFSPPLPVYKMAALLRAEAEGMGLGKKKSKEMFE